MSEDLRVILLLLSCIATAFCVGNAIATGNIVLWCALAGWNFFGVITQTIGLVKAP